MGQDTLTLQAAPTGGPLAPPRPAGCTHAPLPAGACIAAQHPPALALTLSPTHPHPPAQVHNQLNRRVILPLNGRTVFAVEPRGLRQKRDD